MFSDNAACAALRTFQHPRPVGLKHSDLSRQEAVEMMNRLVARFAYRAVFASEAGFESLVRQYAHESPTVKTTVVQSGKKSIIWHQSVFGKRSTKRKREG